MIHFLRVEMKNEIKKILSSLFLFNSVSDYELEQICGEITPEIKKFKHGEKIYSPYEFEKKLGFVLSGECSVERIKQKGSNVPLNLLCTGDSFGIMAVLSKAEEFPTVVIAKKESKILFISETDALHLMNSYSTVAMNVINFLAKKIEFLNKKVATFSSDTVEEKLASLLLLRANEAGADEFVFNAKKSAEAINIGRASLYRAISSLSLAGLIILDNKKIIILDRKGLERI
jgi:CRP-like cAMP-binding protein